MKKTSKKLLSLVLSLVMVCSIAVPLTASATSEESQIPVVYVRGKGCDIYNDYGTANQKYIAGDSVPVPDGYITEQSKAILPKLALAFITDDYDDYCNSLADAVTAIYTDFKLDENGEPRNNSAADYNWTVNSLGDRKQDDGTYYIESYFFEYDWRLDPFAVADTLNNYINDVITATGANKVNLVSRCLGSEQIMTYLQKYGCGKINCCVFMSPTAMGCSKIGDLFSGKIHIDTEAADRYFTRALGADEDGLGEDLFSDTFTLELAKASIDLLTKTKGINMTVDEINNLYAKIGNKVLPKILRGSYGTCPSYWSMVDDEHYEEAKEYCFGGHEEEYKGLIEKIDNYHYNVLNKIPEILKDCESKGMKIANLSKYGVQETPLYESSDELNDDLVTLAKSSFGATCSKVTDTLSDDYIEEAKTKGTYSYISPDKQVDASTCLFPETTWFIRGMPHGPFNDNIQSIAALFMATDGTLTVNDDARYPQYLLYEGDEAACIPLTEDNYQTTVTWSTNLKSSIFKLVITVLIYIFHYLSNLFNSTTTVAAGV